MCISWTNGGPAYPIVWFCTIYLSVLTAKLLVPSAKLSASRNSLLCLGKDSGVGEHLHCTADTELEQNKTGIPFLPALTLSFLLNKVKKLKEQNKLWKEIWKLSEVFFLVHRNKRFCCFPVERLYFKLRWHWSESAQGAMVHIAIARPESLPPSPLGWGTPVEPNALQGDTESIKKQIPTVLTSNCSHQNISVEQRVLFFRKANLD